jgi:hypothetical protein
LILDFEFDQHLESHKHVISIIMGFRDTGCYSLGHASSPVIQRVLSENNLSFSKGKLDESVCDACQKAKSHELPFPKSVSVSKAPLELIFSNVWGPAPSSVGRFKYYVSFIDDYSKFTWFYLLKNKSDVFSKFRDFQQLVEKHFNRKIFAMQTDWGGEYQKLAPFFQQMGIAHHVSCTHTPTEWLCRKKASSYC